MDKGAVSRDDVEKTLWMASSWQVTQPDVDRILDVVDKYAVGQLAVPPAPRTIADLPGEERARLAVQREADKTAAYEAGRQAGRAEVRKEDAVRPSPGLSPLPGGSVTGGVHEATDGTLWLALGHAVKAGPVTLPGQRTISEELRRCTYCRENKPRERFAKDPKTSDGLRTQCKDCEADVRRARKARKAAEEQA